MPTVTCQNQCIGEDPIPECYLYIGFIESHLYSINYDNIYFFYKTETFEQLLLQVDSLEYIFQKEYHASSLHCFDKDHSKAVGIEKLGGLKFRVRNCPYFYEFCSLGSSIAFTFSVSKVSKIQVMRNKSKDKNGPLFPGMETLYGDMGHLSALSCF